MYHTFYRIHEARDFLVEYAQQGAKPVVWGYPTFAPRYVVFIPNRSRA